MIRTAALLMLLTTSAFAQDWRGLLKQTDRDLRQGRYTEARKTSIKLINSMMDNLNRGDRQTYTLALTIAYRAVAEAGLKKYEEADWYWHVARALYPKFDVTPYGEAGAWLAERTVCKYESTGAPPSEIRQPVCLNRRDPEYPLGAVVGNVAAPITAPAWYAVSVLTPCGTVESDVVTVKPSGTRR